MKAKRAVIALDIGGTTIKGAVFDERGMLPGNVREISSTQQEDAESILRAFSSFLRLLRRLAEQEHFTVLSAGVGIPSPFDYENGVSLMRHKFRALYGRNLKAELEKSLGLPVCFLKDSIAFALGVRGVEKRFLGITIGTGLGSGFLIGDTPASERDGAPKDGEIWNTPYRNGILEDFVSRRALERTYREKTGEGEISVLEIAELAQQGDDAAREAFSVMGESLGEGLALAAGSFRAERIVVGGKISKAHDLFLPRAQAIFIQRTGTRVPLEVTQEERAALIGSARHAFAQRLVLS